MEPSESNVRVVLSRDSDFKISNSVVPSLSTVNRFTWKFANESSVSVMVHKHLSRAKGKTEVGAGFSQLPVIRGIENREPIQAREPSPGKPLSEPLHYTHYEDFFEN